MDDVEFNARYPYTGKRHKVLYYSSLYFTSCPRFITDTSCLMIFICKRCRPISPTGGLSRWQKVMSRGAMKQPAMASAAIHIKTPAMLGRKMTLAMEAIKRSNERVRQRTSPLGNHDDSANYSHSVGFWDWRLNAVRKEAFMKWTLTTAFLMAFIIGTLSIYWGAFNHVERNLSSLVVYVVDFDGQTAPFNESGVEPVVGPQIVQLAQQMVESSTSNLGYGSLPPSDFNYDPLEVRRSVYNWDAWAAIIINPNATAMLYSAVQNGNASYDPMGACQLIYIQARDETNWSNYMFPLLSQLLTQATSMVGQTWARQILQEASSNQTLLDGMAQAPQALSPAIGFSMFNLRPFYPYVATPAVSIGLIYLIIVSFFSFSFYLPIHFKVGFIGSEHSNASLTSLCSISSQKDTRRSSSGTWWCGGGALPFQLTSCFR